MRTLLIIDMLNDFCTKDGALYVGPQVKPVIENIRKEIESIKKKSGSVIYLCDEHTPNDEEFKLFPPHCIAGSHGECVINELEPTEHDQVFKKNTFSGVRANGQINDFLMDDDELIVCGVCTSICVMETVSDLSKYMSLKIKVLKNCCCDLSKESHEMALNRMATLFGAEII